MDKYRAWDNYKGRMITDKQDFVPLIVTNKGVFKLDSGSKKELWYFVEDYGRFDLMKYSESKDENGTDVYEKDILKYGNDMYLVMYRYSAFILKTLGSYNQEPMFEYVIDRMKVVGNVYENPEQIYFKGNC